MAKHDFVYHCWQWLAVTLKWLLHMLWISHHYATFTECRNEDSVAEIENNSIFMIWWLNPLLELYSSIHRRWCRMYQLLISNIISSGVLFSDLSVTGYVTIYVVDIQLVGLFSPKLGTGQVHPLQMHQFWKYNITYLKVHFVILTCYFSDMAQ